MGFLYDLIRFTLISYGGVDEGVYNMSKKFKNSDNGGNWIGVGTAIGVAVFALTNEPVWIAVGVAIGAALGWRKPNDKNEKGSG